MMTKISNHHRLPKTKRYKTYILESEPHILSIIKKYGMPSKARVPLTEDLIERVMKEQRQDWRTTNG